MVIAATTSNRFLSRAIRWMFKCEASHFIVVFDNKFVMQSNLYGVGLDWFFTFLKTNRIVDQINIPASLEEEEQVYRALLDNFNGESYDWRAFFFFAFAGLKHRFLGEPMPTRNEWGSEQAFLCSGIGAVLPEWVTPIRDQKQAEMLLPGDLVKRIREHLKATGKI